MGMSELFHVTKKFMADLPWLRVAKFFERVDSTQSRVIQWLPKEADGGVLVVVESQTRSVGRLGKGWMSPPGGIWFTLGMPWNGSNPQAVGAFSLVSALAVTNALKEVNDLKCQIKWPNDIQYNGKKLGGILLGTTKKYKKSWLLVGVGINVNNDLPSEIKTSATSIKNIRGHIQGRSRLIESILSNIWTAWTEYEATGFGPYKSAVEANLVNAGAKIQLQVGKTTVEGEQAGIDTNGALLLKSKSEIKTVYAGEMVGFPS